MAQHYKLTSKNTKTRIIIIRLQVGGKGIKARYWLMVGAASRQQSKQFHKRSHNTRRGYASINN